MENLSLQDPGRAHTSSELLLERFIAKFNEPWDVEMESSSASVGKPSATQTEKSVEGIGESHANQVVEQLKPLDNEEFIGNGHRKWKDIPPCGHFNRNTLSAEISKFVVRLVCHYDQHERNIGGAVHLKSICSKLRDAFQTSGGQRLSDKSWLHVRRIWCG